MLLFSKLAVYSDWKAFPDILCYQRSLSFEHFKLYSKDIKFPYRTNKLILFLVCFSCLFHTSTFLTFNFDAFWSESLLCECFIIAWFSPRNLVPKLQQFLIPFNDDCRHHLSTLIASDCMMGLLKLTASGIHLKWWFADLLSYSCRQFRLIGFYVRSLLTAAWFYRNE